MQHDLSAVVNFLRIEISARVHQYFADLSSSVRVELQHERHPLVVKNSILFEISVFDPSSRLTRGIFVKIPKRANEAALRRIYENFVSLYALSIQLPEELNVVRPLDFFPQLPAILTERVDGEPLNGLLRSGRGAMYHGDILENCGRFLRACHEHLGRVRIEEDFSEQFFNQCMSNLRLLEDDGIEKRKIDWMMTRFEKGALKLRAGVPVCESDYDYKSRNIIVRERQIFFIDVEERRKKAIYADLAKFLNGLTLLFKGTPWFLMGVAPPQRLSDRFLKGYFGDAIPFDIVGLFCAKTLCLRWHSFLRSLSKGRHGVTFSILSIPLRERINSLFFSKVRDHLQNGVA
jgi:hypothetical protein